MAGDSRSEIELRFAYEGAASSVSPGQRRDRSLTSRYHRRGYQVAKRLMDVSISLAALLVLFPVFLAISFVLSCIDGLPVIFKQQRIGFKGQMFEIHKYRTMVKNAEEILRSRPDLWEEYRETFKIKNDPRISKFGQFLRKTSLDEFPQLFNVLIGNMSLVGPRPIVEPELEKYGDQGYVYLAMKPGCAGLWQCMGRSATTYEERVELDREYFENASPWFDMMILYHTAIAILRGKGAQ